MIAKYSTRRVLSLHFPILLLYVAPMFAQPLSSTKQATVAGTIDGIVLNEKGQPVDDARAYVNGVGPMMGAIGFVLTDKNGHFVINRLEWGTYYVFAEKESDGYPDMTYAFYASKVQPVSISASSPKATVTVRVGPPCGFLYLNSITDAKTGRPVQVALMLRRVSEPSRYLGINKSSGPILIPSDTDISIEVSAKGYQPWPPDTEKATLGIIRLKPRETFKLNIQLQPINSSMHK